MNSKKIKKDKLNEYKPIYNNREFKTSELIYFKFIKPLNIFLSADICSSFDLFLIIIMVKPDTYFIILLAIIIFVGLFAQSQVIQEFKEELDSIIEEIFNVNVKIKSKGENNEKNYLNDLVQYTIDVNDEIIIPEYIKLIKFDDIIIYSKKIFVIISRKINYV